VGGHHDQATRTQKAKTKKSMLAVWDTRTGSGSGAGGGVVPVIGARQMAHLSYVVTLRVIEGSRELILYVMIVTNGAQQPHPGPA
jgi:hypothetical protein